MASSNIVIHIDDDLDERHIHRLEQALGDEPGVLSACFHERTPHLMVVDYDPSSRRPSEILQSVRSRGLRAEMLGL